MKNKQIQGLRAIAVLGVVLYHAELSWIPGGFIGVDVFFVISGFLITQMIVKEISLVGSFSFSSFYARRLRRLLPAAAVVIMSTIGISRHLISPLRFWDTGIDGLSAIFYGANYRFYFSEIDYLNLGSKPSLFLHFWSLAVEEQFYLIWPLLILVGYKLSKRFGILIFLIPVLIASFYYSMSLTISNPTLAFYSLPTRGWEFAIGSLLFFLASKFTSLPKFICFVFGWTGLSGLVYSMLTINDSTAFPGLIALLPTISTAFVILASINGKYFGSIILSNPLFSSIGAISYSLYLWHWPVYQLMKEISDVRAPKVNLTVYFCITLILTVLTYFLVEKPIRNYERLSLRPAYGYFWGASVSLIAAFVAVSLLGLTIPIIGNSNQIDAASGKNQKSIGEVSIAADNAILTTDNFPTTLTLDDTINASKSTDVCLRGISNTVAEDCITGDLAAKNAIVLFGDSHAAQWEAPLTSYSKGHTLKLYSFLKRGCGAANLKYTSNGKDGSPYPECDAFRKSAISRIIALKPTLLIVSTLSYRTDAFLAENKDTFWESAYSPLLNQMAVAGIQVLIMGDTPYPIKNIPECLTKNLTSVSNCDVTMIDSVTKFAPTSDFSNWTTTKGAIYFDSIVRLCRDGICPAVINGLIVYRDSSHLTNSFSSYLGQDLGKKLDSLLLKMGTASTAKQTENKTGITSSTIIPSQTVSKTSLLEAKYGGTCSIDFPNISTGNCVKGKTTSNRTVILFGDSHADQWEQTFDALGKMYNFKLLIFTKAACPPFYIHTFHTQTNTAYPECAIWRDAVIKRINSLNEKPLLTVFSSLRYYSGREIYQDIPSPELASKRWIQGYSKLFNTLNISKSKILLLADTPNPVIDSPDCISKNLENPSRCDLKVKDSVLDADRRDTLKNLASMFGTGYLDSTPWLCNNLICPAVIKNHLTYMDNSHISKIISIDLVPRFDSALQNYFMK